MWLEVRELLKNNDKNISLDILVSSSEQWDQQNNRNWFGISEYVGEITKVEFVVSEETIVQET